MSQQEQIHSASDMARHRNSNSQNRPPIQNPISSGLKSHSPNMPITSTSGSGTRALLNNQLSDKNFQKMNTGSLLQQSAGAHQINGIDMGKLQQLKAYQPPKLDYLAQMKSNCGANSSNQDEVDYKENTPIPSRNQKRNQPTNGQKSISKPPSDFKNLLEDGSEHSTMVANAFAARSNLISADASNQNPRLLQGKQQQILGPTQANSSNAPLRNDQTRESLQSRLIERIHSKKIQHNSNLQKNDEKRPPQLFSNQKELQSQNSIVGIGEGKTMTKSSSKRQIKQHLDEKRSALSHANQNRGTSEDNKSTERRRTTNAAESANPMLENFGHVNQGSEEGYKDTTTEKKRAAGRDRTNPDEKGQVQKENAYTDSVPHDDNKNPSIGPDDADNNEDIDEQEEGIQADDEDNDQIETERATNPVEKRQVEMQKILSSKGMANTMSSSGGFQQDSNVKIMSGKDGVQILNLGQHPSELHQIKESYEGNSTKNGPNSGRSTGQGSQDISSSSKALDKLDSQHVMLNSSANAVSQKHIYQGSKEGSSSSSTMTLINPGGGVQPHPNHPDKLVTASGQVIKRPKSKQQSKKQKAQQAQSQPYSKFSELRKLQSQNTKSNKALDALKQSMNQQVGKPFNFVEEEQENEDKGSDGGLPHQSKSLNPIKLSNLALGGSGSKSPGDVKASPRSTQEGSSQKKTIDKLSHDAEDGQESPLKEDLGKLEVPPLAVLRNTAGGEEGFYKQRHVQQKKQSAIKNYGDIANQLLGPAGKAMSGQSTIAAPMGNSNNQFYISSSQQQIDQSNSKRTSIMEQLQSNAHPSGQNSQRGKGQQQYWQQQQNIYQMQNPSQIYANGEVQKGFGTSTNRMTRQANTNLQQSQLTQSQDNTINSTSKIQSSQQLLPQQQKASSNNNRHPNQYTKKFAATSNNFYRTSHQEQAEQFAHKSQDKEAKQSNQMTTPTNGQNPNNFNSYSNLNGSQQKQNYSGFGANGQATNPSQSYYKQYGGGDAGLVQGLQHQNNSVGNSQVFFGMNQGGLAEIFEGRQGHPQQPSQQQSRINQLNLSNSQHHNPHNVYANNTSYGYRDHNQIGGGFPQGFGNNYRDNSFNNAASRGAQPGQIFGGMRGPGGASGGGSGRSGGAYNDHQFNIMEQGNSQANPMSLQFGGGNNNNLRMGNHSLGRNTFYVSDYQIQKQSREFNNQSMGRRAKKNYGQAGPDISTAQGSYNMNQNSSTFIKPRAVSRQADAHIRIEVHKDQRIIHHLQGEKQENMNLMFYNFNDFNNGGPAPNGRRPTAGAADGRRPVVANNGGPQTQGGMRTQNNFYKSKNLLESEKIGGVQNSTDQKLSSIRPQPAATGGDIHEAGTYVGDRVPTRERQYRSAHQNVRRRDITTRQYQQQQVAAQAEQKKQAPPS